MPERRETGRKPTTKSTSKLGEDKRNSNKTNTILNADNSSVDWSKGERIAKWLAAAGVCSRRDAERLIEDGLVAVDGQVLDSPAYKVTGREKITVEGARVGGPEKTRLWRFHKPKGLVTTNSDPEGRPTVFESLPKNLPRVMTIGRLDLNTEGLLLLTNDGELARVLELPKTGLKRCYRARAYGVITQPELDKLQDGVLFEGVVYRSIVATLDKTKGENNWIDMTLTEGKKREARRALESVGLIVNRLIRVSYGPFELGDLPEGAVAEIPAGELLAEFGESISRHRRPDPGKVPQTYVDQETPRRRVKTNIVAAVLNKRAEAKPVKTDNKTSGSSTKEHRYAALRVDTPVDPAAEPRDYRKPSKRGEAKLASSLAKARPRTATKRGSDKPWIIDPKKELPQRPKTEGSRRDRSRAKGNIVQGGVESVVPSRPPRTQEERRQDRLTEKKQKSTTEKTPSTRGDGGLPWNERAGASKARARPAGVRPTPKRGGSSSKTDRFKGGKSGPKSR